MELMQQYEREYLRIVQIMQSSLQGPTRPDAGQAVRLERDIKEAEDLLAKMTLEARSAPTEAATTALLKVQGYKRDLAKLKETLTEQTATSSRGSDARAGLGISSTGGGPQTTSRQREHLLTSTAQLEKTGQRLTQSRQMMADCEAHGASILESLHSQRETILRAKQRTEEVNANISQSQKILKRMGRWLPF